MPKQSLVQYLDDFDGEPLPDDTEPLELTFNGVTYSLYLSEQNESKLAELLSDFIEGADVVEVPTIKPSAGRAKSGSRAGAKSDVQQRVEKAGHTFTDVKNWALTKGTFKTAKGDPISPTAPRLAVDVWEAYEEEML